MASEQVYGVTPPISVTLPTEAEKRASDALIEELRRQKTFESPSDTDKRHVERARPHTLVLLADCLSHLDIKFLLLCKRFATNSSEK
jgi:hypothetical protein